MRTVRLAARARNRARPGLAWLVIAIVLGLLLGAAARATAAPLPDLPGPSDDDSDRDDDLLRDDVPRAWSPLPLPRGSLHAAWLRQARAEPPCDCDRDDVLRVLAHAPPLAAVTAAALRAAGLADNPTPSWRRGSRFAALVPWISVRVGATASWRDELDPTINYAEATGASFAWRLDRLVYDPNEPRFAAADLARRRDRRQLTQLVSRAYFAWAAAEASALRDGRWLVDAYQARADLDALTEGWFSSVASH